MKILMVSSFLPYPLFNGGNIRLYNLLKHLSKKHQIILICEKRKFQTEKDLDEVKKFCQKVITVERKKQWSVGNILKSIFSLDPFLVVGHTSLEMKEKIKEKEKKILFIGDFKWIENRNSAKWILEKIWPKINLKFNIKLWVVGRKIPQNLKKMRVKNIIFDENLLDTKEAYKKSYILLSPIKVGGGTSFKILEAMASGTHVVTTSLGAEGIATDKELVIADSSQDLIDKTEELLLNSDLYEKIAKNARKKIEENFDWKNIAEKLDKAYREVIYD